jgi:hypothetical protein
LTRPDLVQFIMVRGAAGWGCATPAAGCTFASAYACNPRKSCGRADAQSGAALEIGIQTARMCKEWSSRGYAQGVGH